MGIRKMTLQAINEFEKAHGKKEKLLEKRKLAFIEKARINKYISTMKS